MLLSSGQEQLQSRVIVKVTRLSDGPDVGLAVADLGGGRRGHGDHGDGKGKSATEQPAAAAKVVFLVSQGCPSSSEDIIDLLRSGIRK